MGLLQDPAVSQQTYYGADKIIARKSGDRPRELICSIAW